MTKRIVAIAFAIATTGSCASGPVRKVSDVTTALNYEEYGAGDPIVCLHGFGASAYTWRRIMPALSAHHKVFAVDLKGFGGSPAPADGRYGVADQAALVVAFIAEHRLTSVTLVGHSFGGGVALAVATELERSRPGTLAALILIDAAAYPQRFPDFIRVLRMPVFGPLAQRIVPARTQVRAVLRRAYHDDSLITDEAVETYAAPLRTAGGREALRETARHILPDNIEELTANYPSIRVPTLVIWGRHDAVIPIRLGERLHEAIAGSRFVVIETAGHQPQEETPADVSKAIDAFWSARRRPGT